MAKIILRGFLDIPPADLDAVSEELPKHVQRSRAEDGCLTFQVTPDAETKGRFSVYEEFENEAAFEFHQARVQTSRWGRITRNARRHYDTTREE